MFLDTRAWSTLVVLAGLYIGIIWASKGNHRLAKIEPPLAGVAYQMPAVIVMESSTNFPGIRTNELNQASREVTLEKNGRFF